MTFPSGPPPGGPWGPNGQQAPPPWDPRAVSRPFDVPPGPGPAPQYPVGAAPIGPSPNGPGAPGGMPGPAQQMSQPGQVPYPVRGSSQWVVVLRVVAVLLVALGLSIPFDSSCDWAARTTWSIFAIVATVAQLLTAAGSSFGWDLRRSWLIGAVATGALTLHWLLIALPNVGSNAGFCLTFGTAAAIGSLLLAPGRRW